jgi:dTDP-4-amino-4,6-dideoxygalactose transaminase
MKIEFGNLGWQYAEIKQSVESKVLEVLESGNYVSGANVLKFEMEFAQYTNSQFSVCLNSGTSALHSALLGLGVGKGDEVICPSHTFIATATSIVMAGAIPVLVEVNEHGLMDQNAAINAISPKTKAVIPVHLYGSLVDQSIVQEFKSRGISVIEDSSQAHGAMYANGESIGKYSDIATYSFYPGKNLGAAGEGGAITTSSDAMFESVKLIRNWGSKVRYNHEVLGFNYRMDEIQAVVLREKLKHMHKWNTRRREIASLYISGLENMPLRIVNDTNNQNVFHQFVIKTKNRDSLQKYLLDAGVITQIHYPIPIHKQDALKEYVRISGSLSNTENLTEGILSLPIYPGLTDDKVEFVIAKITEFYAKP